MRSNRRIRWAAIPVAVGLVIALAGCSQQQLQGWLPTTPGTTNHVDRVMGLWVTSWIVLLAVGLITWGLIIWAAVVYRRRKGQTGLPVQMRYNMPIEIFYTIVPLILVLGFFAFTAKDQSAIEKPFAQPDVTVHVYGKRWAWDFNYIDQANVKQSVYYQGIQAQEEDNGTGAINTSELPTLYLPVGKKVKIELSSRDVDHSFWIVDFLYKKDMLPGKTNYEYFIPEKVGTYQGKCAELCGEYHSLMLFQVKVVSPAKYQDYLDSLKDQGKVGLLGNEYSTNTNQPNNVAPADAAGTEK
ncbi:aa3-type cytochrome oxidase subunit II [Curtobacterium sp. Leaf261]|uniref:aa3-type cytochrome oxidase subunit II n=1 Tax=Curtobacterium sp. Leaf261 TaxID=1736311 RepID=UPI0006F226A6|nr:cytochrome c oxidase subunit II [Curtobacterium sp. Leaf261]KQO65066.1 cytochrome C oxidase subunit II [Curtobacterium sp. Leaf261]